MKKLIIVNSVVLFLFFASCGNSENINQNVNGVVATKQSVNEESLPINISIFLDLSDRITKENQVDKDLALVKDVVEIFKKNVIRNKIQKSKDKIKVFFYPVPLIPEINVIATSLEADYGALPKGTKRKEILASITDSFGENLAKIYESTMQTQNWVGSDIWGFFENQAKKQCVKSGYRNVLVILSDGFIFHAENKQKEGNNYTYITKHTLKVPNSGLIPCTEKNLEDLDVLFLEVDASVSETKAIKDILSRWFDEMGIKRYQVERTDLPSNTRIVVEDFFERK